MNKIARLQILLVIGILILCSLLAIRFYFRLDATATQEYTLSSYTKGCLSDLNSTATITWYRSSDFAQLSSSIRYIEDMLEEYRIAGLGHVSYMITDPANLTDTELIKNAGIVPQQFQITDKGKNNLQELYSGFLIEYAGNNEVIPFLVDTDTLEYGLTCSLIRLEEKSTNNQYTQTVNILYGISSGSNDYQYISTLFSSAGFTVRQLSLPVKQIEQDSILFVIGSSLLDEQTVAAISSFIHSGGHTAFFVSGNTVNITTDWVATSKSHDFLLSFLADYGIMIEKTLLLDKSNYRLTMPALDNSGYRYIDYPFWITTKGNMIHTDLSLLAGINQLQFFWPSPIQIRKSQQQLIAFITSGSNSAVMKPPYDTNPFGNQQTQLSENSDNARNILAVCTAEPGIIVVADELFPGPLMEYTASYSNSEFLINCAQWLFGNTQLLTLKHHTASNSANIPVNQKGLQHARILNLIIIPLSITIISGVIFYYRKRKK